MLSVMICLALMLPMILGSCDKKNGDNDPGVTEGQSETVKPDEPEKGTEGLEYYMVTDEIYGVKIGEKTQYRIKIVIPKTHEGKAVTQILPNGFENATNLQEIVIPDSVTTIGESAFNGCKSLATVTIPDGVTSIRESAFNGCKSLAAVMIPDSVTTIGYGAFSDCTGLRTVYYGGKKGSQWNQISIDNSLGYNDSLLNATRYYYSETKPTGGNYWHWVDGTPTKWKIEKL